LAGSASGSRPNITGHTRIEGISTNDMVNMSGWSVSWFDHGIEALNGQF
jgi:hypothetical protein